MKTWKQLALFLLMIFVFGGVIKVNAEERTGIVVDKHKNNLDMDIYVRVDEKRPYDHILRLVRVNSSHYPGMGLNMMIEIGAIIVFEDEGMVPNNTAKRGDQNRIISIDGVSVLEMFPNRQDAFPYAQQHQNR
jgi:hypothetical protein